MDKPTDDTIEAPPFSQRTAAAVITNAYVRTGFIPNNPPSRTPIISDDVPEITDVGIWQGKSAILKILLRKPDVDDADMIQKFTRQNGSSRIRTVHTYMSLPWRASQRFGCLIVERLDAPPLFRMPFASESGMRRYADFYQEYREHAIREPWLKPEDSDSLAYASKNVRKWKSAAEAYGRLDKAFIRMSIDRFMGIARRRYPDIPLEFCHRHLTAADIRRLPDGGYVIFSNKSWCWRPQWHDLASNVWTCLLRIRDTDLTFPKLLEYVERWRSAYKTVPHVRDATGFDAAFNMALLERTLETLLVELGTDDVFDDPQHKQVFDRLLSLHQRLFLHLAAKL